MFSPFADLHARYFLARLLWLHPAAVVTVYRFAGWRL